MSKGRPTWVSSALKAASALSPVLPEFAIAPHQTPHDGTSSALTVQDVGVCVGDGDGLGLVGSLGDGLGSGGWTEPITGAPAAVGASLGACSTGSRRVCVRRYVMRSCGSDTTAAPALGAAGATARLTRPLRRTRLVTSAVAPAVAVVPTRVDGAVGV